MTYALDANTRALAAAMGAAVGDVDAKAEAAPKSFQDRDALIAGISSTMQMAEADGVLYRRESGLALPGLNNWRPLDDTLDLRHVGSTSELSSDFVGRFQQAANDAAAQGWKLRVSRKADGTPYEYQFLDHTLTGDLRMDFDSTALLKPAQNFQHFVTGGSRGPYTITAFPYDAATHGPLSAMMVTASGSETKLVPGTDFTVEGNTVTLLADPPADGVFAVASRKDAMRLVSTSGAGHHLSITGEIAVDLSGVGYVFASASGSGLALDGIDHVYMERLRVKSPAGYGGAPLDRRGDSAMTLLVNKSAYIGQIHATGLNDLALYASGGGNAGRTDNSRGLYVGSIYAERCTAGAKVVRQGEQAYFGSLNLVECGNGFITGTTDGLYNGGGIHIGSLNAVKMGRRPLSVQNLHNGSLHVGALSVRDLGYLPDGVTRSSGTCGIFLQDCSGVQVDYLDIRQEEWPSPPAGAVVAAVQVDGADVYGNRVLGGWIEGLDTGLLKTGSTTGNHGNEFTLILKNCAAPVNSTGLDALKYDLTTITEAGGVVSSAKMSNVLGRKETGTPTFNLSGAANAPVYAYTEQRLTYQNTPMGLQFSMVIAGTVTHTETGKELRVYLASRTVNSFAAALPVTLGRATGIQCPAGETLFAVMPPGANYVVLRSRKASGAAPTTITSDHVATGQALTIEISGSLTF